MATTAGNINSKANSKVKLGREVMQMLNFLNIPTENYLKMRKQSGGLEQLHAQLESELSGK